MKAIRIQMEIVFQVEDDEADDIYEHDLGLFYDMKKQFDSWETNPQERRTPVTFDLRHGISDVID